MADRFPVAQVLVCRCAHRRLFPAGRVAEILAYLHAASAPVIEVDDLCALVSANDSSPARWAADTGTLVFACHPRAVRFLFAAANLSLPSTARLLDMRSAAVGELEAVIESAEFTVPECAAASDDDSGESADAWFPVIDRDRCVDCGKCFDFCLFGAYSREKSGVVSVTRPEACKTNCPACARICPANAIIFPKSPDEAINGAELDAEALRTARIRLRPEDMLRGDVYSRLKARMSGARGRLFRPGVLEDGVPPAACPFAEPPVAADPAAGDAVAGKDAP
jgi:ferredoxin